MNRFLYASAAVVLTALLTLVAVAGFFFYAYAKAPLCADCDSPTIIELAPNMSAAAFLKSLNAKKLIRYPRAFRVWMRIDRSGRSLKAGVYALLPQESLRDFLQRVVAGDVVTASFRIIEGSNLLRVTTALENAPWLDFQPEMLDAIRGEYPSAEGLLLADTYRYRAGSSAKNVLMLAHTNLTKALNTAWEGRDAGLPFKTPYELLTAASIVEKESGVASERRLIAGVLVNRLRKFMPLQMDPTVIYALGEHFDGRLKHADLKIDSPYNTYRYRGLPPTPIAMVGRDALDAVAHPEATAYLYYVARGDGTHEFSVDYASQREAIHRYLKKGKRP